VINSAMYVNICRSTCRVDGSWQACHRVHTAVPTRPAVCSSNRHVAAYPSCQVLSTALSEHNIVHQSVAVDFCRVTVRIPAVRLQLRSTRASPLRCDPKPRCDRCQAQKSEQWQGTQSEMHALSRKVEPCVVFVQHTERTV
jgi:hypothetical protein